MRLIALLILGMTVIRASYEMPQNASLSLALRRDSQGNWCGFDCAYIDPNGTPKEEWPAVGQVQTIVKCSGIIVVVVILIAIFIGFFK